MTMEPHQVKTTRVIKIINKDKLNKWKMKFVSNKNKELNRNGKRTIPTNTMKTMLGAMLNVPETTFKSIKSTTKMTIKMTTRRNSSMMNHKTKTLISKTKWKIHSQNNSTGILTTMRRKVTIILHIMIKASLIIRIHTTSRILIDNLQVTQGSLSNQTRINS